VTFAEAAAEWLAPPFRAGQWSQCAARGARFVRDCYSVPVKSQVSLNDSDDEGVFWTEPQKR
jgi:hypothetical protein